MSSHSSADSSAESSALLPEASLNLGSNVGSNVGSNTGSNAESSYYEPDTGINWWIVVLIVVIILGIIGVILYFTVFRKKKCTSNSDCNNQVCNINGDCVDPDRKVENCSGENACKAPRICLNDVCECPSYESKAQDGKMIKMVGPNCEYNDELCNNQGIASNDGKCVCNSYTSPATGKSKQYIGKNCEMSDYDCKKDDIYGIKNANGTCDYCSPNGKKDETGNVACICNHGFLMPYCRQKYTDANCNRGKVNDTDTTTNCLCEDGWDPATDCKECLPGRGPGNGDCSLKLYSKDGKTEHTFSVKGGDSEYDYDNWCFDTGKWTYEGKGNEVCKHMFGPESKTANSYCSSDQACAGITNRFNCVVPKFYVNKDENVDNDSYVQCNTNGPDSGGRKTTLYPSGFTIIGSDGKKYPSK